MLTISRKRYDVGTHIDDLPAVTVDLTSTVILSANPSRVTATIQASIGNVEPVWLAFSEDGDAVLSIGISINPGQHYKIDLDGWYGGTIKGVCANGAAIVYVQETY